MTIITTVGIINDKIIQFVAIFTPLKFLFNVNAIKKAKKVCVNAFAITHKALLFNALENLDDLINSLKLSLNLKLYKSMFE